MMPRTGTPPTSICVKSHSALTMALTPA